MNVFRAASNRGRGLRRCEKSLSLLFVASFRQNFLGFVPEHGGDRRSFSEYETLFPSMVGRLFTVILLSSLANVAVAWRTRAHAPRVKSSTDQPAIQPPLVAGPTRARLRLKKRRSDEMAYAQPSELFWFEPPRKQSVESIGSTQERAAVAGHHPSRLSSS